MDEPEDDPFLHEPPRSPANGLALDVRPSLLPKGHGTVRAIR
jgi:hypothetical protein